MFWFLQENHVNLVHIESRKSKRRNSEFEIFVDCDSDHEQLNEIIQLLRKHVDIVDMDPPDNSCLPEEGTGYGLIQFTSLYLMSIMYSI